MAITSFTTYGNMQAAPQNLAMITKAHNPNVVNKLASTWLANPGGGAIPSTAVATDNSTTGGMREFLPGGSNPLRIVKAQFLGTVIGTTFPSTMLLVDRLSHQGGLDGTVTTAQTTNLPTAALTRNTSGEGVMAALEIYVALGTTATTFTVSYTNQAGTSGRTSLPVVVGGTGNNTLSRMHLVCLQEGDTGVRSVESVTLAGTTATAGNFGITLFKPLMLFPVFSLPGMAQYDPLLELAACLPEIPDDACLTWIQYAGGTTSGTFQANLWFAEDQ